MIIGLTGQSGAGKTAVSQVFSNAGFYVINCDELSHKVLLQVNCKKAIVKAFGDVLTDDGEIDRKKLGKIVFSDSEKLLKLNNIMHPIIERKIAAKIKAHSTKSVIVLDAPTLFESGVNSFCDMTLGIVSPYEKQVLRLMERDRITEENAVLRLKSQRCEDFFIKQCDEIIENDDDLESLLAKAYLFAKRIKNKIKNQEGTNHVN